MNSSQIALLIIRLGAAGNMLIHGIARIAAEGVVPFDGYLQSLGLPPYSAWIITAFEIGASVTILIGKRWVTVLCLIFCAELATGIFLVHYPSGWFVVGLGRNGMEYSVLLILCFISTAIAHRGK